MGVTLAAFRGLSPLLVLTSCVLACATLGQSPSERSLERGTGRGWVRTQSVDLLGMRARLEVARDCRHEPLAQPGVTVLRKGQIEAAKCRSRPFEGELELYARDAQGIVHPMTRSLPVRAGVLDLSFSELDDLLRADGLADAVEVELGSGAWAGHVNLASLRTLLQGWHLHWVGKGRGSASLFVAAHPDAPDVQDVQALAVEAQLARQEEDYLAVSRGALSARSFLSRHLWSPYRFSVREMRMREFERNEAARPQSGSL